MTGQYYPNPEKPSEIIGDVNKETDPVTVETDYFADRTPVDAALINDTPMGGTVASVEPLSGPLPDEIQMFQTPNQEIPMGGTLAAVGPMDSTIVSDPVVVEDVPSMPVAEESLAETTWDSRIGKINPWNDPMDEMLRQEDQIAPTTGPAN